MAPNDAEAAYLQRVEQRFRELREAPLLLSPADFRLAQAWYERGVPLWLVLETLGELFARARASGREGPRSLQYCRPAVDAAFRAWRDARAGDAGRSGDPAPTPAGGDALAAAREAIVSSGAPVAVRDLLVGEIARLDAETLSPGDWRRLDELLVGRCLAGLPASEREDLERRADVLIAPYREAMQPATLERARRAALVRLVRERFRLPDLTLIPIVRS